jgi:hypothetical protein
MRQDSRAVITGGGSPPGCWRRGTTAGLPPATAVRSFQTLVACLASSLATAVRAGTRDRRRGQVRDMVDALPGADELFVVGGVEQFRFGLRLLPAGIRAEAAAARQP